MGTIVSEYGLSFRHVTKGFCVGGVRRPVLADVSCVFKKGVSYAIVGASGLGKSTILHILAGFELPDSGDVVWGNRLLIDFSPAERHEWLTTHIGFTFQQHYLIAELTVYENVLLAAQLAGKGASAHEVNALLAELGMYDHRHYYAHQLSGGQQQRAALARALIKKPTFLIADEPTGNLDTQTGQRLIDFCVAYQKEQGLGLIIATHDHEVYRRMDTVVRLEEGRLVPAL